MPRVTYYESNTGQPIAMAVAQYLCGQSAAQDSSSTEARGPVEG